MEIFGWAFSIGMVGVVGYGIVMTLWYGMKPVKRVNRIKRSNNYPSNNISDGELFWYNDNHGDLF